MLFEKCFPALRRGRDALEIEGKILKKIDFFLILVVLLICGYGLVILSSSTMNHRLGVAHFIKSQIMAIGAGIVAMTVMGAIHYRTLRRLATPLHIGSVLLLLLVLVVGVGQEEWGASRWIRVAGVGFQPADFVKIGLPLNIIYLIVAVTILHIVYF